MDNFSSLVQTGFFAYVLMCIHKHFRQKLHSYYDRQKQVNSNLFTRIVILFWIVDLNLLDWGNNGLIAVPLFNAIYLWNSETGDVEELFGDNPVTDDNLMVTSVKWITEGMHIAVGLSNGNIEVCSLILWYVDQYCESFIKCLHNIQ